MKIKPMNRLITHVFQRRLGVIRHYSEQLRANCFDTVTSNVNCFALQRHHRFSLRGPSYRLCFFSNIILILFIILFENCSYVE